MPRQGPASNTQPLHKGCMLHCRGCTEKKADGGSLKEIVQMLNPESTAEGEETFLDALGAVVK